MGKLLHPALGVGMRPNLADRLHANTPPPNLTVTLACFGAHTQVLGLFPAARIRVSGAGIWQKQKCAQCAAEKHRQHPAVGGGLVGGGLRIWVWRHGWRLHRVCRAVHSPLHATNAATNAVRPCSMHACVDAACSGTMRVKRAHVGRRRCMCQQCGRQVASCRHAAMHAFRPAQLPAACPTHLDRC